MYRVINTSSILAREMAMFFSVHPYTECKLHLESHVTSVAECNDISKVLHLYCFHDLFHDDFDYLKAKTKLKGYSEKVVIDGRNNFKSQKGF